MKKRHLRCPHCDSESVDMPDIVETEDGYLRVYLCFSCMQLFTAEQSDEAVRAC